MSKELKYRAICFICNKPFDSRKGFLYFGHLICTNCSKELKYKRYL